MATTYSKLRSGNWGVRTTEPVEVGQTVIVTKKSGERKQEKISAIVWKGEDATLCAIEAAAPATYPANDSDPFTNIRNPRPKRRARCDCSDPGCECQTGRCHCAAHCNCRGGNVYDC